MSIKQSVNFAVQLRGDGSSTSVTFALATAPMSYYAPNGQTLQPGFIITSLTPSSVNNLTCSDGTTITSGSITLFGLTLTLNFGSAIASGTDPTIYGTFVF